MLLTLDSDLAPAVDISCTIGGTAAIGLTEEAGVADIGATGTGGTGGCDVGTGPAAAGGGGGGGAVGSGLGGGGGAAASFAGAFAAASPGITKKPLQLQLRK